MSYGEQKKTEGTSGCGEILGKWMTNPCLRRLWHVPVSYNLILQDSSMLPRDLSCSKVQKRLLQFHYNLKWSGISDVAILAENSMIVTGKEKISADLPALMVLGLKTRLAGIFGNNHD